MRRLYRLLTIIATASGIVSCEEMGSAPDRNFQVWKILGIYVWPNVKVTGSYSLEVKYLKDFYVQRLEWMNSNINKL